MNSEEELANFQAALLELLDTQQDLKDMRSQLQQNPAFAPFQEYINTFDDKMLEVAAELVKKWGRHNSYLDI
jgi:hypothetical protein